MTWQSEMKNRMVKVNNSKVNKLLLFDSDKVDILNYGSFEDIYGIERDGWKYIAKDIICDVNDVNDDKLKKDYGYNITADRIMIVRYNDLITEDCLIVWNDIFYKIAKIKTCKNYSVKDFDAYLKVALVKNEEQEINIMSESAGDDSNE